MDVIVVGGGPAGSAAAIRCAQSGLSVVIVDAQAFPRDRPGEALHPGAAVVLRDLGVADAVLARDVARHEGVWVEWGAPRQFEQFGVDADGPWRGLQVWRRELDCILLDAARDLGVTVVQRCPASAPLVTNERVIGVVTACGPMRAKYVIDAAGGTHWLARRLGIRVERRSRRLIARYGYVDGACAERDDAPAIVADSAGWTWTARVQPGVYAWTRLRLDATAAELSRPPDELASCRVRGIARGADVTWRIMCAAAGAGYFAVGDAAAVLDPAASHGVLRALMSGILAAHTITAVLRHGASERESADVYRWWLRDWFERDLAKLSRLYGMYATWSAQPVTPVTYEPQLVALQVRPT